MRNKYGIGFFATAIIAMLVITCAYQFSFHKAKEQAKKFTHNKSSRKLKKSQARWLRLTGKR